MHNHALLFLRGAPGSTQRGGGLRERAARHMACEVVLPVKDKVQNPSQLKLGSVAFE